MNTTVKVITGFLAGASVGILAGVLMAPDSGKKTREKLVEKTKGLKDKMTGSFKGIKKAYNEKLEDYVNEGKAGMETLKNNLKV